MSVVTETIQGIIADWNRQCKASGINREYKLYSSHRKKKFYLNKVDFFELPIAEIKFYQTGDKDLMLWRKEARMPEKTKGMTLDQVANEYINDLHKSFLYECIGTFALAMKSALDTANAAEYDFENDRLKQHESANGMVIQTIDKGDFYEIGNTFDVFVDDDTAEYYAVYTQHDIGRQNNGIAAIPKNKAIILENAKKKIILL